MTYVFNFLNFLNFFNFPFLRKLSLLKNYIEHLLSDIADNYEDARLYAKLSKERPEGHVMLNEQEKAEFEDWLGVKSRNRQ